jgi:type I site-specific restriction endonuclease
MNEAETRAERIDPKLKESGWGVEDGTAAAMVRRHQ